MMICLLEECWKFFLRRFQIFKLHIDIQYSTLKRAISHVDKIIKAQKYKQFWVHFYRLQVIRYSKGTQVYYKNVHWQVYIHFHVFTHCHFPIGSLAYRLNVSYTQDECFLIISSIKTGLKISLIIIGLFICYFYE